MLTCYVLSLYSTSGEGFFVFYFFFFQAEDVIRDYKVAGVQTCALPIYPMLPCASAFFLICAVFMVMPACASSYSTPCSRSEERRVGKECRSRGLPNNEDKEVREKQRPAHNEKRNFISMNSINLKHTNIYSE